MIGLLKMFGKGILYVIGFPFFVAALVLFGVIGIFLFLFQLIKSIFYFFSGRKFFPELPEDKELRLLREKIAAANNPNPINDYQEQPVSPAPAQSVFTPMSQAEEPINNNNPYVTPLPEENSHQKNVEKAVFMDMDDDFIAEPLKPVEEEKPAEENVFEDMVQNEEQVQEEAIPEPEPAPQIEPEPMPEEEVLTKEETIVTGVESRMPAEEEVLEEYVPGGSSYFDEEDEEDTNSGVSIDYDL